MGGPPPAVVEELNDLGELSGVLAVLGLMCSLALAFTIIAMLKQRIRSRGAGGRASSAGGAPSPFLWWLLAATLSNASGSMGAVLGLIGAGNVLDREADYPGLCYAQGAITQFGDHASAFWQAALAGELMMVLRSPVAVPLSASRRRFKLASWLIWPATAVIVAVPGIMDMYGSAGPYCWLAIRAVRATAPRHPLPACVFVDLTNGVCAACGGCVCCAFANRVARTRAGPCGG